MVRTLSLQTDFKADAARLPAKLKLMSSALQFLDGFAPGISARMTLSHFLKPRRNQGLDYVAQLPAGAQRIEILHRRMKLVGWAWGETGPAVLLVHGWEYHTERMASLVKPLLEQGFRVVAFDAPGHGLSPDTSTHLIDYADAIGAAIEQHGPFYAIIAHSLGAAATTLSLQYETQLTTEKLILISPMRDLQQHVDIFATVSGVSAKQKAKLNALIVRRTVRSFEECSTINAVGYLNIPGLVIHDRHDALIPYEDGKAIAENWHGAQFITTQRLGHRSILRNQDVLRHILDFLAISTQSAEHFPDFADHRRSIEDIGPVIALLRSIGA